MIRAGAVSKPKTPTFFCLSMVDRLSVNGVIDRLRSTQEVIKGCGSERVEAVCSLLLAFENLGFLSVKTILDKELDQVADPKSTLDIIGDA